MARPTVSSPRLSEYRYELPEANIARYPLAERDSAKLLVWRDGAARHRVFRELPDLLPAGSLLVFNDTRVIPARVRFRKPTGGAVEVFLLRPVDDRLPMEQALLAGPGARWACAVGNLKRWKEGQALELELEIGGQTTVFQAKLVDRSRQEVEFGWEGEGLRLLDVLSAAGETPLPPYLRRAAESADSESYQTVYGQREGAVAAPTAGLHFTPQVLERLQAGGFPAERVTLHVSAGTFKPVKDEGDVLDHPMHSEQVAIGRQTVEALLSAKRVVPVGTTSMRTLESLYWFGVRLLEEGTEAPFRIPKLYPYRPESANAPSVEASLEAVLARMEADRADRLHGATELFIVPGYRFRLADALLTNFHLPESTLLMLVSAFVGPDWKRVYREALAHNYRFLSYGDSSLLFKAQRP